MSDNPFASPDSGQPVKPTIVKKTPGALMTILIVCLVLGIMGLLVSCMTGGMLAFQGQINQLQQQGAGQQQLEFQKKMEEIQAAQFLPNVLMTGANFIVAPLLILGAIGGLNRKPWAHKILNIGLILAMAYIVFKTVMTIFNQMAVMAPMQEMMEKQMGNQQGAEVAGGIMQISMIVGIAFAVVWALVLLGFYIWSWTYLQKDHVKQFFGVGAAPTPT